MTAAEAIVKIAQEAVGASNAQKTAETIAANPESAQAARTAVLEHWYEITAADGGGIKGGRMFQLMGFNHPACGFEKVQDFVTAMCAGEDAQLSAFVRFVQSKGLADEMRALDWTGFALRYHSFQTRG